MNTHEITRVVGYLSTKKHRKLKAKLAAKGMSMTQWIEQKVDQEIGSTT